MVTASNLEGLPRSLVGARLQASNANRKKNRKRARQQDAIEQQALARCASQIPACEAEMRRACDNGPICISLALPCCQALTTCDFTTFFTCADDVLSQL